MADIFVANGGFFTVVTRSLQNAGLVTVHYFLYPHLGLKIYAEDQPLIALFNPHEKNIPSIGLVFWYILPICMVDSYDPIQNIL